MRLHLQQSADDMQQQCECRGSVTLVFLPLKYEIDDSVTVTVVLG